MRMSRRRGKQSARDSSPPDRMGPYRIGKCLGKGSLGEVYQAYDEDHDRSVAIKLIHGEYLPTDVEIERFRRESSALTRLRHPAIVRFYDLIQWRNREGMVLELVEGPTLAERLEEGFLETEEALPLMREITQGLAYIHQEKLLHRDLKASNIKLTLDGHAKILDFSLVMQWVSPDEESLTISGHLVGTPEYMSPEQVLGDPLDPRSDLFSLGTLFYLMLTGVAPFRAKSAPATWDRICSATQQPACWAQPEVPKEISGLIDHLLEKRREDRPQSALEVERLLCQFLPEPVLAGFPGHIVPALKRLADGF